MKKQHPLLSWAQEHTLCFCSFLLPFLSMLLIFISNEIFPFGDKSFMHSDMYHQYVPFLQEFVRKVKEGESLAYSWNVGLGTNYLALFVYYCASPFNWLVFLFPEEYLIEFMSYMVIFKIGLAGFTFSYYLKHHFRTRSALVLYVSVFYAMSGFVAAYNWNVMWMDGVFLAPLVILGAEQLIRHGKCQLYCITLTLSILSNYYLSIMLCLFLCLYVLLELLSLAKKGDPSPYFPRAARAAGRFVLYSLLVGGMSCILLLPELAALRTSEFTQFRFPKKVDFYFSVFDVIARHATGVQNETGLDHWPNLFCSSAVFMLLPLYICNRRIRPVRKAGTLLLWIFMLLGFSVNLLNYIWHGFNYPNSLPARQSFLYIFLVLTLCFEALYRKKGFSRTDLVHCFVLGLGFLIFAQKTVTDDAFGSGVFPLSMALLVAYLLLLCALKSCRILWVRQIFALLALILVSFEVNYHMASTSVSVTSRSSYLDPLPLYRSLADSAREEDPGFYRFEKFTRTTKNDGALADYPTASCFASTANPRAGDWYDRMGLSESKVFYSSDGLTPFSSALLNIRYMFSASSQEDSTLYTLYAQKEDVFLYRCRYTLPPGFVLSDPSVLSSSNHLSSASDPLDLQNRMGECIAPGNTMFSALPVENSDSRAQVTILQSGHYYAYSRNSRTTSVKMTSSSGEKTFQKLNYDYIMDLGWQEAGQTLALTDTSGTAPDIAVYRLDTAALSHVLEVLAQMPFTVTSFDTDSLTGDITLSAPGTLVLSVPYESGWTLKVNGMPTACDPWDGLFCSVNLPAGTHTVSLTFSPPGLTAGIAVSLLSLLLFIFTEHRITLTKHLFGIRIGKNRI